MTAIIEAEQLVRAEKTLRVVYGGPIERQLAAFQIDREAFDNFLQGNLAVLKQRYGNAYYDMDPRLEPAWATLMMHMFLVGLVAGHNQMRVVE